MTFLTLFCFFHYFKLRHYSNLWLLEKVIMHVRKSIKIHKCVYYNGIILCVKKECFKKDSISKKRSCVLLDWKRNSSIRIIWTSLEKVYCFGDFLILFSLLLFKCMLLGFSFSPLKAFMLENNSSHILNFPYQNCVAYSLFVPFVLDKQRYVSYLKLLSIKYVLNSVTKILTMLFEKVSDHKCQIPQREDKNIRL